jgi:hypothetical protein
MRLRAALRHRILVASLEGDKMKIVWNIVGGLLLLIGCIWFLQGINVLPGSFMSGQSQWAVRGGIIAIAGIGVLLRANVKRRPTA